MKQIRLQRTLPHPVADAWEALTDADAMAEWLMPNDFRPTVGHTFTFRTKPGPGFDGIAHGEVLAVEPEKMLQLRWQAGKLDTIVTFTLEPLGTDQTRLTLTHTGFGWGDLTARLFLGFGWPKVIDRLGRSAAQRGAQR
ncbi:MAG: SRPBCC domain-containing protein [Planctomycetota bacterium]